MSAQPQPRLTPDHMYAMSDGSYRHFVIKDNLAFALRRALQQRPCSAGTSDLRVRVSQSGLYTYPDAVVVCGEPRFADEQQDTLLNPTLIAEILSPSTEAYDRGFKSAQYRMVESLQEYVLVSQAEARVEVFRRQAGGDWLFSEAVSLDAHCRLEGLNCEVALAEIYDKVTFEGAPDASRPSPGSD
jgi:Uma2 family endonuclease